MGLNLLFQSGNSMRLTNSSYEVCGKIKKIYEEIDQLDVLISDIGKGRTGQLSIEEKTCPRHLWPSCGSSKK